ncbi:MAG: hypothetical protein SO170_02985 [Butyribacter sp.]|nr:hypothetical protein [bacterium]MDY3853918.1 hypothetical protein [Butyribacter sp.]
MNQISNTHVINFNEPGRKIRTYVLAKKSARQNVNLKNFSHIIIPTIQSVIPGVMVRVDEQSYTVYGIKHGEAVTIGRMLAKEFSTDFAVQKAVMFVSVESDTFDENELYYPDIFQ